MRLCECGCGQSIEHLRPQARYLDGAHRLRAWRDQRGSEPGPETALETVSSGDRGWGPTQSVGGGERAEVAAMTPEQMRARLDALAQEFDRAGSTTAMRREARALAKALGQDRPRWLPRDEW